MRNDKLTTIRDFIVKNSKFLFPVIVIAAVAVTVSIALNAGEARAGQGEEESSQESTMEPMELSSEEGEVPPEETPAPIEIPLAVNEDAGIQAIVTSYYDAMVSGDSASMAALYDNLSENELLRCEEVAKYLERVSGIEVYSRPGPVDGTTLVYVYYRVCFQNHAEEIPGWQMFYVCDNGQGGLYIKDEKNFTEEEKEYVKVISNQDDTVEFNNRVNAEYNELMEGNPQLLAYLGELGVQVDTALGVRLAEMNAATEPPAEEGTPEEGAVPEEGGEAVPAADVPETAPVDNGPQYATATTTVNVRSSDSEQADKLGKVVGGTKVQVQEVRVNGWTKIVYEGGDGYIKSEYLQMEESAEGLETIGTVTANTNINVRSAASEEAEVLGILPGGESLELLGNENGWCKVKYSGKVAYVKADYVTAN
ncbi:MAG: SH3 domain-containing protein [Lachnospiraceae bacterium]|uniref:SH3 domain-containing protein n=1 Tax=uncultured Acetatifactor sp. TaxID=1671927 RepID=UPI0026152EA7|nr:SH3 domain-containing protein [uncultured Acetatifactor sp.]MCI8789497.1 SH3 domain-containing protein [Lachnospiraceae bacterium]